ncbi:M56 family metallopeptidase [Olleya sp. YS]|uniref:M56 family metallopeptidase n=1 Tax=Olleya sp. YS TaxID=3028318 RepID=UPI0024340F10|nr:M56 family metallopeptidase [Olleya sp. YS]WGD33861.1 M56 family metallopeptidase [Olleya sp. YS]
MDYFLKASAVIILFYACYKLFLQRETFFQANRWFFVIGLIISACIPLLVIPVYIEILDVPTQTISIKDTVITQQQSNSAFNFYNTLQWCYAIGILFFSIKLIFETSSLIHQLYNKPYKSIQNFKLIETNNKVSPFSFFNWIVYNPNQFNKDELSHIINHEKIHAKQYHSIDIIVTQLACIVFWFNPFIWLYKKEMQQNLEFIADQKAQSNANCDISYQQVLLKVTIPNYKLAIANNFYNSLLKKRIIMLHKSKSSTLNAWKYFLILPALALFLMSFNTKDIYITKTNKETNTTPNKTSDIEILMINKYTTDAELSQAEKEFKKKDVTLKFKSVKRNSSGEIIAIKISAKTKDSNANFSVNSDNPINPIKIIFDQTKNSVSIGNGKPEHGKDYHFSTNDDHTKIITKKKGNNVFVISSDDNDKHHEDVKVIIKNKNDSIKSNSFIWKSKDSIHVDLEDIDDSHIIVMDGADGEKIKAKIVTKYINTDTLWVGKKHDSIHIMKIKNDANPNKNTFIIKKEITVDDINSTEDSNVFIIKDKDGKTIKKRIEVKNSADSDIEIRSSNGETPLIIIDGKEAKKGELKSLNPDDIKSMNVIKGEQAKKLYGDKGKDGVIEIKTKK